ncbi:Conjugal transfer protein TrbD [Rickettsiales bacterium Ac37b]|nr:Conjugal transfer protein TrbD [Rickettsiales bacterium Ac37b]
MNTRDALRKIIIHKSLTRTQMLLGGERSLVLMSALSSFIIGLIISLGMSFMMGVIIGAMLWLIEIFLLRNMARSDPLISKVYLRSCKYKSYYPAKGRYDAIINIRFN